MREALEDYESVAGASHPDDFAYVPFHTPFPGMVRKAAVLAYRHMIRDTPIEEELAEEIGFQPREDDYEDREAYEEAIREHMDALGSTAAYGEWYDAAIEPTLDISREVGNWYTGSVHIARAAALKRAAEDGRDLAGEVLGVGSYGSGAQAEVHAETVRDGWKEEIDQLNVDEQIEDRYDLSFAEYENVHDRHNHDKTIELEDFTIPDSEFVFTGRGRMNERTYEYVE